MKKVILLLPFLILFSPPPLPALETSCATTKSAAFEPLKLETIAHEFSRQILYHRPPGILSSIHADFSRHYLAAERPDQVPLEFHSTQSMIHPSGSSESIRTSSSGRFNHLEGDFACELCWVFLWIAAMVFLAQYSDHWP